MPLGLRPLKRASEAPLPQPRPLSKHREQEKAFGRRGALASAPYMAAQRQPDDIGLRQKREFSNTLFQGV
jgi:hypothetical protein